MNEAGTLAAVEAMNDRRELMVKVAVLLESSEADLMRDFIALLFRRATLLEQRHPRDAGSKKSPENMS